MLKIAPIVLVCLCGAIAQADAKAEPPAAVAPAIPDTPAGRTLRAWLDAFNSGDRARIEAYGKKYDPTKPAAPLLEFRRMTGGFPGKKLAAQPVYVLTSNATFSGGEEFTYDLKSLKRATIVGETTGGGAHPAGRHRVDDHFLIVVPSARPINPVTKTDWEGKGVAPDVKVPADQALEMAEKLAAARLAKAAPPAPGAPSRPKAR